MSSRKLFSYVVPQMLQQGVTSLGQHYEVNLENGVKVLNSENANYSFGSLHKIMQKGITTVFKAQKPENILMLGLGAGSALSILASRCKWPYKVTVVEIDSDLIRIAREHFDLGKYGNTEVLCGDAAETVTELDPGSFDLIIDDIFWDDKVPAFCMTEKFLSDNARLLTKEGTYMRNTMNTSDEELLAYAKKLSAVFSRIRSTRHAEFNNKIYLCQR